MVNCHDQSWYIMTSHDKSPEFIMKNHQKSSKVTKNHQTSWIFRLSFTITKNHEVRSPKIMKNISFLHGDFWWLIMINHDFQFPIERGSTPGCTSTHSIPYAGLILVDHRLCWYFNIRILVEGYICAPFSVLSKIVPQFLCQCKKNFGFLYSRYP